MSHMIYRLEAAMQVGWIDAKSSRTRVSASVGGSKAEVDFCMVWLSGRAL
jgi:hypothetical protein